MKKQSLPPKEFLCQKVSFRIDYSWPTADAHKTAPCRARISPLNRMTGKPLTKRELYGKDSDQPVNYTIHGKDPSDIYNNQREAAARYLLACMEERGLLDSTPAEDPAKAADLAALARDFKETFFHIHRREWKDRTIKEYRRQYDVLVKELREFPVGEFDSAAYRQLQEKICLSALKNARKMDTWKYGDEPPSSARKRLSLLYELIQDLKQVEGVPIPAIAVRYNGKPSRQQLLLDRTDSARSLSNDLMRAACTQPPLQGQAGLMADTGLRISEAAGLLWGDIRPIETSQGNLYYLTVSGQLQPSGKRTEITKTGAAYRTIPLSPQLAETLLEHRQKLESACGDLSLRLMCGEAAADEYIDDAAKAVKWQNTVSEEVPLLLRSDPFIQALAAERPYLFDREAQEKELLSKLTCHALRRNYNTWLYCFSGLDTPEIYRQMGHADTKRPRQTATGQTLEELGLMCLRQYVSDTLYHEANALRYLADDPIRATEVPACEVVLMLPPGASIELIVEDTEPGTVTRMEGDGLHMEQIRKEEQREVKYTYGLLADKEKAAIVSKQKLLE